LARADRAPRAARAALRRAPRALRRPHRPAAHRQRLRSPRSARIRAGNHGRARPALGTSARVPSSLRARLPSREFVDAPTYQTIKRLYLEARGLDRQERQSFLDERCAGHAALRAEVEGLLSHEETLGEFLAQPARSEALPMEEPTPVSHPERIGAYRIQRPLGFGGMGVVYLAEQDSPRRAVALKLLRLDSASPRQLERFEREAELLGRLSHPGIARVYEAGWAETETGRRPYFAMEYVEGEALHEHVNAHKLDLVAKMKIVSQVAEAVHYAHERDV